jgi:type IV pilus assembly protein PilB
VSKSKKKRAKLGQMLVAAGAIESAQLTAALEEQKCNGGLLGMALVRMGFVDERTLVRALAGQLNLPVVRLQGKEVNPEVLDLVPVDFVEKHRCLPLLINGEGGARTLYLGMEDPSDPDVVAEICTLVGMNVQAVLVAPTELDEGIFRHYRCNGFGTEPLSGLPSATANPAPLDSVAQNSAPQNSAPEVVSATQAIDPNTDNMEPSCLDDFGPEPSFVGLDELGSEDPAGPLEFEDSPAIPCDDPTEKAQGASASSDAMLSAIAQLLVEKGVFTREELVKQLRAMSKPEGGA